MIGTWSFTYTLISTFTDHLRFSTLTTMNGIPVLVGSDLDDGAVVIAERTADLPGNTSYTFAALHIGVLLCDFVLFDQTSANSVSGLYLPLSVLLDGSCAAPVTSYAMAGVRTGVSLIARGANTAGVKVEEVGVAARGTTDGVEQATQLLRAMQGW